MKRELGQMRTLLRCLFRTLLSVPVVNTLLCWIYTFGNLTERVGSLTQRKPPRT